MELSTASSGTSEPLDNSEGKPTLFYMKIILCSLGLIGNAFVCLVMLRYHKVFNSTTNKLIIHQSIVDFLASLLFILRHSVDPPAVVPDNFLGSLYCILWWLEWPQFAMLFTSTYNLVAISLERFFATCHPVRYRNMFSSRRLKMILAAVWLTGWIPPSNGVIATYQSNGKCGYQMPFPALGVIAVFIMLLVTFIIPIAVMVFAYTRIIVDLHKRSQGRDGRNQNNAGNALSRAEKNVTKTLFLVAVLFTLCWITFETVYLVGTLGVQDVWSAYETASALMVVNLCVNPFIYCFTYERFQRQVRKMVCGGCQRNVNRVDTTSGSTRQETNAQHNVQVSATVSVIGVTDNPV